MIFEYISSPSEEFIDSWRAESVPTAELELLQLYTALPSLSILLQRFLSLQETPPKILRWRELHQDICNLQSEEMKNLTPLSRQQSLAVVSSHISTKLWSWSRPKSKSEMDGSERTLDQHKLIIQEVLEN